MRHLFKYLALAAIVAATWISVATDARASTYNYLTCTLTSGAVYVDTSSNYNVTLYCVGASNGIPFYAFPTTANPAIAQMILSTVSTTMQYCATRGYSSCTMGVYYDSNSADNPTGCGAGNCRALNMVDMFP